MAASAHKLALELASRISEVLPEPFVARAAGGMVALFASGQFAGGCLMPMVVEDEDQGPLSERVETAVRSVLDNIQDWVTRDLTVPWPAEPDGSLALPGASVEGERVMFWYGGGESPPVMAFAPIELRDLSDLDVPTRLRPS